MAPPAIRLRSLSLVIDESLSADEAGESLTPTLPPVDAAAAGNHNGFDTYRGTELMMISHISDVELRTRLDQVLEDIRNGEGSYLVTRGGIPAAAVINAELFAKLCRLMERFDTARSHLRDDFASTSEEVGMAEIDAAVEALRKARG